MVPSPAPTVSDPAWPTRPSRGRRRATVVCRLARVLPSFTFNRTRLLALKVAGLRIGPATLFWGLPELRGDGPVANLSVGSHCGFNDGCVFELDAEVRIADHVSVGHEVRFLAGTAPDGARRPAAIAIGEGSWLGARATVHAGVTVGAGSVIGAGVTVTADVPPNTLLTGGKPISLAKWR